MEESAEGILAAEPEVESLPTGYPSNEESLKPHKAVKA
jgi:hypothetical protein